MGLTASFLSAALKAQFNSNSWQPVGEPQPLKTIWDAMDPSVWKSIDGDYAEVTSVTFNDGGVAYRLSVPIKGGNPIDLSLSPQSDLYDEDMVGEKVPISSITGQELHKAGRDNIVRYDGELAEEEEEPEEVVPAPRSRRRKI